MCMASRSVFAEFEEYAASIEDADVRVTLTNLQRHTGASLNYRQGSYMYRVEFLGGELSPKGWFTARGGHSI